MRTYRNKTYYFRLAVDIIVLNVTYLAAAYLVGQIRSVHFTPDSLYILIILNFIWYFSARTFDVYDEFRVRDFASELVSVMKCVLIQFLSLVVLLYLFREMSLSRYFVFAYAITLLAGLLVDKVFIRMLVNALRKRGRNLRHVVIVGARDTGMEFHEVLSENPQLGYNVLGFVDNEPKPKLNGQYLGKLEDLEMILTRNPVDDVVVTLPVNSKQEISEVIETCDNHLTRVKILPDYFSFLSNNYSVSTLGKFPVISVRAVDLDEVHYRFLKRGCDIVLTVAAFVFIFSWLWPLLALGVKLSSPGPVFFTQERWGRNNKKIKCYKFRSMHSDCPSVDENGNYIRTSVGDPRITPFGRFIRKTNLDELPQFWNVLKGEMSVVGPRPHATPLNLELKNMIDRYTLRHLIKPGITGWAQVNGFRGGTKCPKQLQRRVGYDLWYIENWSFWLDLQIIFMTVWNMFKGEPEAY